MLLSEKQKKWGSDFQGGYRQKTKQEPFSDWKEEKDYKQIWIKILHTLYFIG